MIKNIVKILHKIRQKKFKRDFDKRFNDWYKATPGNTQIDKMINAQQAYINLLNIRTNITGSSNGRTTDFDSVNHGSSPCPVANHSNDEASK